MKIATAAEAATRILELRNVQASGRVTARVRDLMTAEERDLWDKFFRDVPLEQIEALIRYN